MGQVVHLQVVVVLRAVEVGQKTKGVVLMAVRVVQRVVGQELAVGQEQAGQLSVQTAAAVLVVVVELELKSNNNAV